MNGLTCEKGWGQRAEGKLQTTLPGHRTSSASKNRLPDRRPFASLPSFRLPKDVEMQCVTEKRTRLAALPEATPQAISPASRARWFLPVQAPASSGLGVLILIPVLTAMG